MSIMQGKPLPNIDTSKTTTTSGPDYYSTYLTDIAKVGTDAIARDATSNVAGLTDAQKNAIAGGSNITAGATDITGAQTSLDTAGNISAASAANPYLTAGTKTSVQDINSYMDPYRTNVVDEIGRLGYQNIQSNIRPQQTGRSVAGGDFGSRRAESILGQVSRDAMRDVLGAQSTSLSAGYKSALDAASRDLQRQIESAKIAGDTASADAASRRLEALAGKDIGVAAQDMAIKNLEEQYKMGEREQKYNQDIMNEPLVTAQNAANLFSNLKVPTTVSEKASAPIPGAYSNSPLSQLAGVGSLFASGAGGQSAIDGMLMSFLGANMYSKMKEQGMLGSLVASIRGQDPGATEITNTAGEGEAGYGWKYYSDGTAISPDGVYYYQGKKVWEPDAETGSGGGSLGSEPGDTTGDYVTDPTQGFEPGDTTGYYDDPSNWSQVDNNWYYVGPDSD